MTQQQCLLSILSPFFKQKGEKAIDTSILLWCRPSGPCGPTFFPRVLWSQKTPDPFSCTLSSFIFPTRPFPLIGKKNQESSKHCLSRKHPSKTTALNYVLGEISSVPSMLEKRTGSHEKQNQGTSVPLEKWGTREAFKNERVLMLIINAETGTSKIGVGEGVPGRWEIMD